MSLPTFSRPILAILCLLIVIATPGCKPDSSPCDTCPHSAQKGSKGGTCCPGHPAGAETTEKNTEKITETPRIDQAAIDQAVATIEKLGGVIKKKDKNGNPIVVDLEQCQATSDDVKSIAGASTIKSLVIWGAGVKDPAIDPILTMPNLTDLTLYNTELTDEGVAKLAAMKDLKHLNLRRTTNMTDEAMASIKQLEGLETLALLYNNITDEALAYLSDMPNLKVLDLRGCMMITDMGMESVATMPKLKVLKLRSSISNDGLAEIAKIKTLEALSMQDAEFDDEGLAVLAGHEKLRDVNLFRSYMTDEGMRHIAAIPNLAALALRGAAVSGEGLNLLADGPAAKSLKDLDLPEATSQYPSHWMAAKSLKKLDLSETSIDNNAIVELAKLPKLKWLKLWRCTIDDGGAAALGNLTGLEYLSLSETGITDVSLESLANLKKLKELDLKSTGVTDEGIKKLQKALPNCTIKK